MPAFQAAVQDAGAASVMCAYSYINGNAACNNAYTETNVLRDQWDFPGFVTSDYGALHGTDGAVDGTDQEQPFNTNFGAPLETAVENGTIPQSVLNTMVQRDPDEMFRFNLIANPRTGSTSTPVHHAGAPGGRHRRRRDGHHAAEELRLRAPPAGGLGRERGGDRPVRLGLADLRRRGQRLRAPRRRP